jgi:hypothetical protein
MKYSDWPGNFQEYEDADLSDFLWEQQFWGVAKFFGATDGESAESG